MFGVLAMMSNDAASSSANRFGAAARFVRHQLSTSRIWSSASGVVRTGRLTGACAIRPRSPTLGEDGRPQLISRISTALRAKRATPHHPLHRAKVHARGDVRRTRSLDWSSPQKVPIRWAPSADGLIIAKQITLQILCNPGVVALGVWSATCEGRPRAD